jgi:hypothetical protein
MSFLSHKTEIINRKTHWFRIKNQKSGAKW